METEFISKYFLLMPQQAQPDFHFQLNLNIEKKNQKQDESYM